MANVQFVATVVKGTEARELTFLELVVNTFRSSKQSRSSTCFVSLQLCLAK
jgi:hypothetical protein